LKGRHVTDLKHEILGLNINISQRTMLLYCNDSVLFHKNNFTLVYIHILREIYCFLSCRMECYNFWHSFKSSLYETCKYALNMSMRPNLQQNMLSKLSKSGLFYWDNLVQCHNLCKLIRPLLTVQCQKSNGYIK